MKKTLAEQLEGIIGHLGIRQFAQALQEGVSSLPEGGKSI
jgi:hypothetical protein